MPQLKALSLQSAREPFYKVLSRVFELLKRCSFPKDLLNKHHFLTIKDKSNKIRASDQHMVTSLVLTLC